MHKKYTQEWFDGIRDVKTLSLVTVPKNKANFGLFYEWLFGFTRSLKFLIKITCISRTQKLHSAMVWLH